MVQSRLQKVFKGMLSSQSFEILQEFSDDSSWQSLQPEEKELLAQLFLLSAEATCRCAPDEESRSKALTAYRNACQLLPSSAKVWYRLGSFLILDESEQSLKEAVEALKQAVTFDPEMYDAQYALASASLRLGALCKQIESLYVADSAFSAAASLVEYDDETGPQVRAEFYWHWGLAWYLIGKESGEPVDFKRSIQLFESSRLRGAARSDFYNDYANALVEVALLTSNEELIFEALRFYSLAIDFFDPSLHKDSERTIWLFNKGCCYQYLYDLSSQSEYFEKADAAYSEAASLSPDMSCVWQRWGGILFKAARVNSDVSLALEAVRVLRVAEEKGVVHPATSALLSQALGWVGNELERYDLLKDSEDAAQRAISLQMQHGNSLPEPWVAMALCQYEYGKYFNDDSYFERAGEIVQKALSEYSRSAVLWYASAKIKFALGKANESVRLLKESAVSFFLASRSSCAQFPDFWEEWGLVLYLLADWTEDKSLALDAISKFEKRVELIGSEDPQTVYNIARAFDLIGDLSDEVIYYEQAIELLEELTPSFLPALSQLAACHLHLGELISGFQEFTLAIELYASYLEKEPEDGYAWVDYALSLIHKGVHQREGECIPGEWFEAEDALLKAVSLSNTLSYYHLGSLYALMGNVSESIEALSLALEHGSLPPVSVVREDKWLESLENKAIFQEFLTEAARQQERTPEFDF